MVLADRRGGFVKGIQTGIGDTDVKPVALAFLLVPVSRELDPARQRVLREDQLLCQQFDIERLLVITVRERV